VPLMMRLVLPAITWIGLGACWRYGEGAASPSNRWQPNLAVDVLSWLPP
jgi:hypothetical protein